MDNHLTGRGRLLLLSIAALLLLSACSRINLAYRNLDILIPWTLNDYLDMNSAQQSRLKAQLREHLAWHCSSQLPIYLEGMQRLQHEIDEGQIDVETLRVQQRNMHQAIRAIAVQITPSVTELVGDLDDSQVQRLQRTFEEKNQELHEKFVAPDLPRQIRERAERMQKRVEYWTGRLDAPQRQRILQWSHALSEQNARWLDNRKQWQTALVEVARQRHEPDFASRLERLLQDPESFWTQTYRRTYPQTEQETLVLISDLYAMASDEQRSHLSQRLHRLRSDLGAMTCLSDAVQEPNAAAPAASGTV